MSLGEVAILTIERYVSSLQLRFPVCHVHTLALFACFPSPFGGSSHRSN